MFHVFDVVGLCCLSFSLTMLKLLVVLLPYVLLYHVFTIPTNVRSVWLWQSCLSRTPHLLVPTSLTTCLCWKCRVRVLSPHQGGGCPDRRRERQSLTYRHVHTQSLCILCIFRDGLHSACSSNICKYLVGVKRVSKFPRPSGYFSLRER